jgi:hypothetical protein
MCILMTVFVPSVSDITDELFARGLSFHPPSQLRRMLPALNYTRLIIQHTLIQVQFHFTTNQTSTHSTQEAYFTF